MRFLILMFPISTVFHLSSRRQRWIRCNKQMKKRKRNISLAKIGGVREYSWMHERSNTVASSHARTHTNRVESLPARNLCSLMENSTRALMPVFKLVCAFRTVPFFPLFSSSSSSLLLSSSFSHSTFASSSSSSSFLEQRYDAVCLIWNDAL